MDEPFGIVPHRVVDSRPGGNALAIYVVLARHANSRGECWPGLRRIAELSGLDVKTVRRGLDALSGKGLIEVLKHANGQRQEYRLSVGTSTTVSVSVGLVPTVREETVGSVNEKRGSSKPKAWEPVPLNEKEREKNKREAQGIWDPAKDSLRKLVDRHSFDTWLRPSRAVSLQGNVLLIELPTCGHVEHVKRKYPELIESLEIGYQVEFVAGGQ